MLLEERDVHARVPESVEDLCETVVERHERRTGEGFVVGDIAELLGARLAARLEVRIVERDQTIRSRVAQRPQHRMPLADEELPTGSQKRRDDFGPPCHVWQPTQRADPGVDEVEATRRENRRGRVEIGLDERRLGGHLSRGRVVVPPRVPVPRSRDQSPWRRAGAATRCRYRCGTAGGRSPCRSPHRDAARRSAPSRTGAMDRRGNARPRSPSRGAGRASPSSPC